MKAPFRVLLVWILIVIALVIVVFVRYDLVAGIKRTMLTSHTEQTASMTPAPSAEEKMKTESAPVASSAVAESKPQVAETKSTESSAAPKGTADLANGKKLFEEKTCALCHGQDGTASSTMGKSLNATNLASLQFHNNKSNLPAAAYILQVIENGVPGTGMVSFKSQIPAQKDREDLVQYVLTLGKK